MKFTRCRSRVVPLLVDHVDTDQIIPARFLKTIERSGLGEHLFSDWKKDPSFVLNRPEHEGAEILLAGQNFGCGSSREHAPWALLARGFRAIIAGSFADIFKNNALKNGLLPVAPSSADYRRIVELVQREPKVELEVDLSAARRDSRSRPPPWTRCPSTSAAPARSTSSTRTSPPR
jgi:3-isopropylmalate/(R)-2-methylmalate dehydratase small subunit